MVSLEWSLAERKGKQLAWNLQAQTVWLCYCKKIRLFFVLSFGEEASKTLAISQVLGAPDLT